MTPSKFTLAWLVAVAVAAAAGCSDSPSSARHDHDASLTQDAGSDALADTSDAGEAMQWPDHWTVAVADDAPEAVHIAATDVHDYLTKMGLTVDDPSASADVACAGGQGRVVFVGDGLGEAHFDMDSPTKQTWRIDETRCDNGVLVELAGGGLLGRQYAAYQWLHRLGVRFFHPEEEYVPDSPDWPDDEVHVEHTPAFKYRSVTLHLTHPLELGDVFKRADERYKGEGVDYIDWQIKNGASYGTEGVPFDGERDYGVRRGLPTSTGFNLHETQQGGHPIIDPDDPRPVHQQIADAIDQRMGDDPDHYPDFFGFNFNPSEFTELPDTEIVDELTFIANYMAENYPDTIVMTINHGTHGAPTEHYGVRFYDLPEFAPPNLGVKVHTLMFYDLFRPAPVYGNENFHFLYDFMVRNYQTRRLWYFPEAAYWLTFDIAVPLYLPITIEARSRDIDGIAFMLAGKLDGHRVFGTGQEWGYWQNEYCSFRMAADLSYDWHDCLADIAYVTGPAADEVQSVMEDLVGYQERDIIYGDVLPYIVGTDHETEVAASIGVQFHPLPPSPKAIMGWDADKVADFHERIEPQLERMEDDYMALIDRLDAVKDSVPDKGRPWFDEIYDGIEVSALRARHGRQVYGALVRLRESQLRFDQNLADQARQMLDAAEQTTQNALDVIHRREQHYRYKPLSRSIAGGPDGTEDDNWSIYHYRYLNRTHYGFYYKKIDQRAEKAFQGSGKAVEFGDAILSGDEQAHVQVTDTAVSSPSVDFGDGTTEAGTDVTHAYGATGVYSVTVSGQRDGSAFDKSADVAEVDPEYHSGFSGKVVEPSGVDMIEPVLPALTVGEIGSTKLAVGFGTDDSGDISADLWEALDVVPGADGLDTRPQQIIVPVVNRSSGDVQASLTVESAKLHLSADRTTASVTGELATDAVIHTVVSVGGFNEQGARGLVANLLGYTPDTLPERVPFEIDYTLDAP